MLDRRAFVGSLALATLAAPRVASPQPARKVHRIGILGLGVTSDMVGPQPRNPFTNAQHWARRHPGELTPTGQRWTTYPSPSA